MNEKEILSHVDHTILKPVATYEAIRELCTDAVEYDTASVCIPACYVKRVRDEFKDSINICTVVGFPLGYETTEGKLADTLQCLEDGADEIDMVINVTDVKNGDFDKVTEEIETIKKACGNHILKVIVETCYLTKDEKIKICKCVTKAGADYIKTSTGFGTDGARIEDIKLFKEHIGTNVKIKAAGGIRTLEAAVNFIEAGCDRIGTSNIVAAVKELENGR